MSLASFVSLLFFQWMNNVFKTGSQRPLEENDLLPLSEENLTSSLTERLHKKWRKENTKCKGKGKRPKLWKSVIKMLSVKDGMIIVFTGLLRTICGLLQPLFLGYLISGLTSAEPQHNYLLYGYALAMGIITLISGLSMHQADYRCELLGIRISSALKGLIYLKVSTNKIERLCRFTLAENTLKGSHMTWSCSCL